MPGGDPSRQRRKLKAELQKARSAADLTQRQAAQVLHWSESKIIRVENGQVGISVTDLQAMLHLYGVTDEGVIADLSDAARGSRGSSWWSHYRDVVSPKFALYLGQEASASSIRVFHPFLIPGLLHTEEYALALLRVHSAVDKARRIGDMRRQRQQSLLGHEDSPKVIFVFGEEALHRWIGGPEVMQAQLQHLLDISENPGISVEVIPFGAGAHPGLLGPFILLDFEDPREKLLFVEGISGELVSRDEREKVTLFDHYFETMRIQALKDKESRAVVEERKELFRQAGRSAQAELTQTVNGRLGRTTETASTWADAGEDRWESSDDDASSLPPRRPPDRKRSSAFSPGRSMTGVAPCALS
jgi:transcriptional regulator with XRE-family HTH domain